MPQLLSYPKHLLPHDIAIQAWSYARIQWPHLDRKSGTIWPFDEANPLSPTTFVLVQDELLISHAEANRRGVIRFAEEELTIWGVSGVFTYPAFRGTGLAKQVVRAATEHINASDADVAMLFCGPRLRGFYSQCGWTPMDGARVLYGNRDNPRQDQTGQIMMLFPSERGRRLQQRFLTEPVFVGPSTW